MSHDCCHTHDHCHNHDHHQGCCHEEEAHHECCNHDHECHDHESFADQLLELADDAWMEVLHEKLKKAIEAASGKHLEKLAKIVADANKSRWQHKLQKKEDCEAFKAEVAAFFEKKA